MKAWERELDWIKKATPPTDSNKREENWMEYLETGIASDKKLMKDWISFVPGSLAPCHIVVAAVQSMYNRGYDVSKAEDLIEVGLKAAEAEDGEALQQITARIYAYLNQAPKDEAAAYWKYNHYSSWEEIKQAVTFPETIEVDIHSKEYEKKIAAGWMGQLIGGALGTQIEGYTTENIRKTYGEIREYLRSPETYNDDITYELAFLEGFSTYGYEMTSEELAFVWLGMLPDGYSAEEMAIRNLRRGIMPPESGIQNNYFTDWIGVQMRTPIHGMLAPGNPKLAAELAARDGVISHSDNGVLGGIFNAVLTSLAFVESDIPILIRKSMDCIPKDSEYYSVIEFAYDCCCKYSTWEEAWGVCEEQFKEYHWIHAYPNAAAEMIALWFGNGDFDETAFIIVMEGMDVDCTAAPILNVLAVMIGLENIDQKWIVPIGDNIDTYMRKLNRFTFQELCNKTVESVRKAVKSK